LSKYLVEVGAIQEWNPRRGLADLIRLWKAAHNQTISIANVPDLQAAVDDWRSLRNKAIHGIVQGTCDNPESSIASVAGFLAEAKLTAEKGRKLADLVSRWCDKALRAIAREKGS
jgi:hypothetical protein